MTPDDPLAQNRANWDERVPIHVASRFYDVEHWLGERPGPRPREVERWATCVVSMSSTSSATSDSTHWRFAVAGARVTGQRVPLPGGLDPEALELAVAVEPDVGVEPGGILVEVEEGLRPF